MPTYLSRRQLFARGGQLGLLGAVAAAGLSGCGADKAAGGSGGSMTFSLWGNASRSDLYKKALALFDSQHSGVTFTSSFADLGPYLDKLATQAAAGGLPDVFFMRDTHVSRYAGSLLALDDRVGKTLHTTDIGAASMADGQVSGKQVAVPTHYVGQALIINTTALDKYQMKLPANPTWDQLAELAIEISKAGGKGYYGTNDPCLNTTQRHFEAYVRQRGEELYTTDGKLGFTADTFGEWMNYWDKLRKAGAIPPADIEIQADASNDQNLLVKGKAAILWESSNHLTQWQKLVKDKLTMTSLPQLADSTKDWWFFPPILMNVSAKTKNADTSVALLDFFLNSVDAAKITTLDEGAPSSKAIRAALLPTLDAGSKAFIDQIDREMTYPRRPLPVRPKGNEDVNSALTRYSQAVAYGKQSITDAAKGLIADSQAALQ